MLNPFEENLRKRLKNYEENPVPGTWEGISQQVVKSAPTGIDIANWLSEFGILMFLGFIIFNNAGTGDQNNVVSPSSRKALAFAYDSATRVTVVGSKKHQQTDTIVSSNKTHREPEILAPRNFVERHKKRVNATQDSSTAKDLSETKNFISEDPSQLNLPAFVVLEADGVNNSDFPSVHTEAEHVSNDSTIPLMINQPSGTKLDFLISALPKDTSSLLKKESNKSKYAIFTKGLWYAQATPVLTYQRLESNRQDDQYVSDLNSLPIFSPKRLGFRIEVGREWALHPKLKISAGLVYLQRRQQIAYSTRSVERMEVVETSSGTVTMTPVFEDVDRTLDFQSKSVGFSTQLTYLVTGVRLLKSYVGMGLDYQFALSPVKYENEFSEPTRNLNLTFLYRVTYPLSERVVMYTQPSYSYAVKSNNSFSTSLYSRPYTVGIGVGIVFKINR